MDSEMSMQMPVVPAYGAGNGQNGFGFGGDWAWILLLLVLFGNNGWGNGNGNGGGMGGLYPWMNNSQNINDGFRDQMLNSQISGIQNGITSGFGDVQNALCSGFAGVNAAITANQMALQSQFANCCCENRLATANLSADIAREACANRTVVSDGIRDLMAGNAANTNAILGAVNGGIQAIKDQLCQDKIDAKNDEIAQLRAQINALNLAASQQAQTAQILANNEAQTAALERYLAPNPIPAYVVANPACCGQTYGTCGCGT